METRVDYLLPQLLSAQTTLEIEARGGYHPDISPREDHLKIVDAAVEAAMEREEYFAELAQAIVINESSQRCVARTRNAEAMKQVKAFFAGDSEGRSR